MNKFMARKRIPRKYVDLIHIMIFIVILLLFANYESEKNNTAHVTTHSYASGAPQPTFTHSDFIIPDIP